MEEKILGVLTDEPQDTLKIARLVIDENPTQKAVNPTLYKLLKEKKVEKVEIEGVSRPSWKKVSS